MGFWNPFSSKKRLDVGQHIRIDEHGCRWVDKEFFDFGDFSKEKDNLNIDLPSAQEYLELYGHQYPWRNLWLARGRAFAAPTRQVCLDIKKANGHLGGGNCYNASLQLALGMTGKIVLSKEPEKVLYTEGVAIHPTGAYLHAWLIIDGRVYDPTWPDAHRVTYFGVTFDPRWMLDIAETFGKVSLLQGWEYTEPRLASLFKVYEPV